MERTQSEIKACRDDALISYNLMEGDTSSAAKSSTAKSWALVNQKGRKHELRGKRSC